MLVKILFLFLKKRGHPVKVLAMLRGWGMNSLTIFRGDTKSSGSSFPML